MLRAILPLFLGALLGSAAVYVSNRVASSTGSESPAPDLSGASTSQSPPIETGRIDRSGERASDDESANTIPDDSESVRILERTATEPEALLVELADLSPPVTQREVALAVLAALGNDDAALSRVAAMLPEADRLSFRIDALGARAQVNPGSALRSALALNSSNARGLAISKIAEVSTQVDAAGALASVSLISDRDLRILYLASVAETWAEYDAIATLGWLESAVPYELSATDATEALRTIAESNHDLLLARIDSLSPALQPAARHAAILALAERDPEAALAEIDSLDPGRDITDLEGAVAEQYALVDPAAAVEWAKTRPNSQTALEGALMGAATVDYDVAVDLAMQVLETEQIWAAFALGESGAGPFSKFVDRLLASSIPEHQQKFIATMTRWPQVDAEAALQWAVTNMDAIADAGLDRRALGLTFQESGREYAELAIAAEDRIRPEFRELWINAVAQGVAAADPDRALVFIERFRGEPGYEDGLSGVISSIADSDPVAAARLVERTGARAAGTVGWAWAQTDPVAASNWVADLEDPVQRRDGVSSFAANWSRTDPSATMDWLLDLPADQARDYGLQTAISALAAATGSLNVAALEAIGDDQIRDRAAMNAIIALGRSDSDEARRLVDIHIENPNLRQQALQRIAEQGAGIVSMLSSSIDVPR